MAINASAFVDNILAEAREMGEALKDEMNLVAETVENQLYQMLVDISKKEALLGRDIDTFNKTLNDNLKPIRTKLNRLSQWKANNLDLGVDLLRASVAQGKVDKQDEISKAIATFSATYLPVGNAAVKAYDAALTLAEGRILAPAMESAIWQRDRERLLADAQRSRGDFMATFAARGFPLPPGAAAHAIRLFDAELHGKIAVQSRDVAIKQAELLLDNARIGVEKLVQIQQTGVALIGDYLKSYLMVTNSEQEIEKLILEKTVQLWGLQKEIFDAERGVEEYYADQILKFTGTKIDTALKMADLGQRSRQDVANTLQQQMRALGDMSSAAYNSVHASAGVSAVGETD